ncbi:hypothetical protein JCM10207_002738 [Rhodosporidiobolus poonsookiae]
MLPAPPIQQPLQPLVFPPPPRPSEVQPGPLPPTATVPAHEEHAGKEHRHSRELRQALDLLRRLSDQVDGPAASGEDSDDDEERDEQGIIANLESHGWTWQTTTNDVRIFHSFSEDPLDASTSAPPSSAADRAKSIRTLAGRSALSPSLFGTSGSSTPRGPGGPASMGLRADETLPFFRGEGWIDGRWRREDVAATITSIGARSVWDPRLDASHSYVAEHLNSTDSLYHLSIRGTLVSDRDAALCTTIANDTRPGKDNILYIASTSVEDALLPKSGTRTHITLNGFALRSLSRAPHFEPPPAPAPLPDGAGQSSPPARPGHRRTRSTMSAMQTSSALMGTIPLPPLPSIPAEHASQTPQRPALLGSATHVGTLSVAQPPQPPPLQHTLSSATSYTNSSSLGESTQYPFFPQSFPAHALSPPKRGSVAKPPPAGPGLAVSMVVRASPGYNLPQTTVNQLSLHLPLAIAAIGRFLASHGFASHLVRSHPRLHVREEDFDPSAGRYRAVFVVKKDQRAVGREEPIRIRFHGASFGRGRFDVEVSHVRPDGWSLEFDNPPQMAQDDRVKLDREDEEIGGPGSNQWRCRLSVRGSSDADGAQRRKSSTTSLLSPLSGDDARPDPSTLSGSAGGCTLAISPSATNPSLPVIVCITRSTNDSATLPLLKMQGMASALARASQVALDDNYSLCDTVEELLECGREGSEERAEMCLRSARVVLREVESAREHQAATAASAAAAAAAASMWGRRGSAASSGGYFGRRGSQDAGPGSLVLDSPFMSSRRPLTDSPLSPTMQLS